VTVSQRRVLGVVGGLVVLLALVFALTAGESDDQRLEVRGQAENAPSTTTSTSAPDGEAAADDATETTLALVPVTTGVPVPDATEAPPVTEPPSATPAAPRTPTSGAGAPAAAAGDGIVVTADGATMTRSPSNAVRTVDKAKGCNSAGGEGWKIDNCGALRTNGTVLLWVVETKGKMSRALVLKEQTAGKWLVVLSAADVNGATFDTIGVRGQDVTGDGQPELVFGFHRKDDARTLSVDVVDASPAVILHRDLVRGSVRLAPGEITTWAASGAGTFDQVAIRFAGGAWRASAAQSVARSAVPASMV
jgi:hypothetical protein